MSNNNISINIENGEEIIEALGVTKAQMKKAVKRTVSDLKQRVPGWISEKVMEEYNIKKKDIKEMLTQMKNKMIVIDNADILLDDETRKFISLDENNQYLIIGRNPKNLFTTKDNLFELVSNKNEDVTEFWIQPYL